MIEYAVEPLGDFSRRWSGGTTLDPDKLNEMGKGGWELILIQPTTVGPHLVFKREKVIV